VYSVIAKAKSIESTAETVEELEHENELLRLKVQELTELLQRTHLKNKSWLEPNLKTGSFENSK
jgi:hypothetical protein